jgi:hypothetical protein
LLVHDVGRIAWVRQTLADGLAKPQPPIDLPQQEQPGIGSQPPAVEIRDELASRQP